jgi:hypothetical protein
MRGWGTSGQALFEQPDIPALELLPPLLYEYAEWKRSRVGLDYHVEIGNNASEVPKLCELPVQICAASKRDRGFESASLQR